MSVAHTSISAYKAIQDKLTPRQQQVLEVLERFGKASNQQIADNLGMPINRITGRVNELVKLQRVEQAGTRTGKYGFTEKLWRVKANDPPEQLTLDIDGCGT